jgi:hypothetical protein
MGKEIQFVIDGADLAADALRDQEKNSVDGKPIAWTPGQQSGAVGTAAVPWRRSARSRSAGFKQLAASVNPVRQAPQMPLMTLVGT